MTGEQKLLEGLGGILCSAVAVEDEALVGRPLCICLPERRRDQLCAGDGGYPVGNDFPGKQVQNDGDVIVLALQPITGDITDPYLIWALCGEILIENILLGDGTRQPIVIFLRGRAHADQAHILHNGCNESLAHPLAPLNEDGADLVRSKDLMILFIYLPNLLFDLCPSLGVPCVVPFVPQDVVVERPPGYLQRVAERVDAELAVQRF